MERHASILEMASGNELLIAWGVLLLAALVVILWTVARKVESRGTALVLGAMILLATAGQFAAVVCIVLPGMEREAGLLREKVTLIELDNVKERDIALAYQRENATLNDAVRTLRQKVDDLEKRMADPKADGRPEGQEVTQSVLPPERTSPASPSPPGQATAMHAPSPAGSETGPTPVAPPKRKWFQPRGSNARYSITILTPRENEAWAQEIEASLKTLLFRISDPVWINVDANRIVYYAEEDHKRAAYLAAFLKYRHKIEANPELAPNRRNRGRFQIYLKP